MIKVKLSHMTFMKIIAVGCNNIIMCPYVHNNNYSCGHANTEFHVIDLVVGPKCYPQIFKTTYNT